MDDMLIAARNKTHIQKFKAQLKKEFDKKNLKEAKKILDMEITLDRGSGRVWLSQEIYILKMLERFNMAKTDHHFFDRSLQIIFQAVSIITRRERCLEYHMLVW